MSLIKWYTKTVVSSEIDKRMSKRKEDMVLATEVIDCVDFMEDEHKVLPEPSNQHPLSEPSNNQEVELLALGLEDYID